jgi:hypothetical protein
MLAESVGATLERLAAEFSSPPKAFSPVPIWWWSGDRLERGRLRWQMEQLAAGGVYNAIILNLAPTGPLYGADADQPAFLSDAWWGIFLDVCADAEIIGMRLWFYDQFGFSGANLQGEIVRQTPSASGQALQAVSVEGTGRLELTCPSEGEALAAACVRLDQEGRPISEPAPVRLDGRTARVEAAGRKRLRLMYAIRRGFDYFSSPACARLLDCVHGAIERQAGHYLGKVIVGSFQDELPALPTWGAEFAEAFQGLMGYDLRQKLAYLWEGDTETAQKVRTDYHQARATLAERAFFRPLFEWHEARGLLCGFDQQGPARSGQPVGGVQLYANYMDTHRWFTAPGSDHHGHAKIHSSLAHLYRRTRVWIEAFHSSGWGGTLEETFDWLLPWLRAGATLYNPHAVYYSTRGGWWEWAPPSTCWRQPYWRHYPMFARAISRLCWLLSQGTHVCDIAILYPTTTIQADLTQEGPRPKAQAANAVFEALAGEMMFLAIKPGVLDGDRRDFDIVNDDSLQRAQVTPGAVVIGEERYTVLILPACAVLPAATNDALVRFATEGGLLIAIGCLPQHLVGGGTHSLEALHALFDAGRAVFMDQPEDLPQALRLLARHVDAPVPVLHRRVAGTDVLFVPAAFPHATYTPDGESSSWIKPNYRFDPNRYQRSMRVVAHGFSGTPELWDVITGARRPLLSRPAPEGVAIEIPFDTSPAALIVWSTASDPDRYSPPGPEELLLEFGSTWSCEVVPTLDNRYGDFDKPDFSGAPPVQTWRFWHRVERPGEEGLKAGWHQEATPDTGWAEVHATFGQYGWWIGSCPASALPQPFNGQKPLSVPPESNWQPAIYSLQRGIRSDPLHVPNLGPKAHVHEEFLHFGPIEAGYGVQFRTSIWMDKSTSLYLALGAAAHKSAWINGQPLGVGPRGYLWLAPVELNAGLNTLEWRLVVEQTVELRAYWALVKEPQAFARPERMTFPGAPQKDAQLKFVLSVEVPFAPVDFTLQVASDAVTRILVNGVEAGRQGGFDPYASLARVQPYRVSSARAGQNTIMLEVLDPGCPAVVLVDGVIRGPDNQQIQVMSGTHWQVGRDNGPLQPVTLQPEQWLDPAWSHLWRRPHPLPDAAWLEDVPPGDTVVPIVPDAFWGQTRVEWFHWNLPPGAAEMHLPVAGQGRLWVDGVELDARDASITLPASDHPARRAVLRLIPGRGQTGGGVFAGPITYSLTIGHIELGDWSERGLEAYSGGLRYRNQFTLPEVPAGRVTLDLGQVRGTAEVWVNGQPAGTRIGAPYQFDVASALKAGPNTIEVLVLNTLAPYLHAVSPTHYIRPGQLVSGLMGPVCLFVSSSDSRPVSPGGQESDDDSHPPKAARDHP